MLAQGAPPACYAAVAAFYALPSHRERGPFRYRVFVDGDWALATWSGTHGGGEGIFRRRNRRWCVVVNGGGALRPSEMTQYGMPPATVNRIVAKMNRGA